jgi:hypothetical protein
MTTNPNDEIRHRLLQYFYDRNANATSRFGKKGSAVKISDVKKELKARHGLTQQQVMSNLTYLTDRGWVNTVKVEKTVRVSGGSVPSTVTWFEISAKGIDKIEGESEFQPKERYPGINITATGASTITLGDGNVVNIRYSQLHEALTNLKQAIVGSASLSEAEKLDAAVDIESIKDQLAKAQPNATIIEHLWHSIKDVAVAAGLAANVATLAPLLARLAGN